MKRFLLINAKAKKLFFICPLMLLFLVTCCATKPETAESGEKTIVTENNKTDETVTIKNVTVEKYFAQTPDDKPFEPEDFARYLTDKEVVKVFHDKNFEQLIRLSGKEKAGRQYFSYQSPLYPKPISSADELFAKLQHQAIIARQLNPCIVLNLDMDIRKGESGQVERKTLALNIKPGVTISDYRRESELRYTVKTTDGSYRYGQYLIVSAIVTQNKEEAALYSAFQVWLEQPEADFSGLFEKMISKENEEGRR